MPRVFIVILFFTHSFIAHCQLKWLSVDSVNNQLPNGLKLYYTNDSLDGKPNIAYYIEADLKAEHLIFDVDTTQNRRLTPSQFYSKNNDPLVVVNGTFFSAKTNQNLNTVIKNGQPVSFNIASVKDSLKQLAIFRSAIGITRTRNADVAWINSDTTFVKVLASQHPIVPYTNPDKNTSTKKEIRIIKKLKRTIFKKWDMQTAIGGGPVLLQNGQIAISNKEERMFTGKAINDKHPRTAMGYTLGDKLIILVIQGRFEKLAEGATLLQEAQILKDIGCIEALNLDGGGSSCMLVNGKETITVSDKTGQRAVPAIFMIKKK
jgi:Phosphodiester glycosidase